jgi:hypothetical protein
MEVKLSQILNFDIRWRCAVLYAVASLFPEHTGYDIYDTDLSMIVKRQFLIAARKLTCDPVCN